MLRNRLFLPVYLPTLLLAFGQGLLIPTFPIYAKSFDVSFGLVSIAVAALGVGTLLADVPTGLLIERLGRKRVMVVGTASLAAASVGLALAQHFPEVLGYRLICGVSTAMWNISRMAYLADATDLRERGRSLATFGGVSRIGTFGGPVVGGALAQQFGMTVPFLAQALLAAAATVISVLYIIDQPADRPSAAKTVRHLDWSVALRIVRDYRRVLLAAGSAQLFAQMIRNGRQVIVPLYGAYVLGLDVAQVGTIVSVSAIIDMSLFYPAGFIMDRFGRKYASVPSFIIMAIGMVMIPLSSSFVGLLVATAVIGLGNGLGSGSMMTLGADLAPKDAAGPYFGIWRLIGDSGSAAGPMVVGSVADVIGLSPAALVLAVFGFTAAGILKVFVEETGRPVARQRVQSSA